MRENLPVTDQEYVLEKDEMIVSKTDLRGKITFVNDDFIRISGFTEEELIGSPQNIVRHPDMPEDAFRDFWDSLKAGRSWSGMVKNRCKNGDHYWVLANASPLRENGEITGYMSIRTKPSREEVQEASKYYKIIREGSDPKLSVQDGAIHTKSIKDRFRFITDLTVRGRLFGLIVIMAIGMIALGGVGLSELTDLRDQNRTLYNGELLPLSELTGIQDELNEIRLSSLRGQVANRPEDVAPFQESRNESAEKVRDMWREFDDNIADLPKEARQLIAGFGDDLEKFLTDSAEVLRLARQGNFQASENYAALHIRQDFDELETRVENVNDQIRKSAEKVFAHSEDTFTQSVWEVSLICLIVVIIAIVLGLMLSRSITAPLKTVIGYFNRITEGKLDDKITVGRYDEIGRVMDALRATQTQLNFSVNDTQRALNANLRIRMALDGVGTGVIITNPDGKVIYANNTIPEMLGKAQKFLQDKIPGFDTNNLEAFQLDDFLRDENWEPCIGGTLKGREIYDIQIESRHLRVSASPVVNDQGRTLGIATEWQDRTAEINAEKEVAAVVAGAAEGDFTVKIDAADKEGFFRQLADGLNNLTDVTNRGLDDIGRVLGAISRRDMTERVTGEYQGKFDELKTYCNETSENLAQMIGEIRGAAATIATAAQEIAQGNTDLSSRTEEQASSLEETASSMEELTSTVKQNADSAKQANTLSDQAATVAGEGGDLVKQVVVTMEDINESSQKIADIIGVIDGIAFQTNILALNAAVEAARAGDQGRGFAVVASEVRSLAQRSANAAKDIKGLISDSVGKIQNGDALVKQAGDTMAEIVKSIKRVSDINSEITAASDEQASGIENVSTAVNQMDEMTQQNAALVEEAAAAAESQQEQVDELTRLINQFRIGEAVAASIKVEKANKEVSPTGKVAVRKSSAPAPKAGKPKAISSSKVDDDEDWEEF